MKTSVGVFLAIAANFSLATIPALATPAPDSPISVDGASLQVVHTFSGADGRFPMSGLAQDGLGRLYGASRFGAPGDGAGVIFSVLPGGSEFRVVHTFTNETRPNGLMLSTNGRLYGTLDGSLATFEMNTDGSGYRILRSVPFSDASRGLIGPLVEGSNGLLLGAIEGFGGYGGGGIGTINKDGTGFTETHHLTAAHSIYLQPPLAQGPGGRFYGVSGNDNQQFGSYFGNFGTLFSVESDGTGFENLVDLGALGWVPNCPLLAGSNGNLYGMATSGDTGTSILWRTKADGSEFAVLQQFRPGEVGMPFGELLEGTDGRLYGTTRLDGNDTRFNAPFKFLITRIFSIDRDGSDFAVEWEEVYRDSGTNPLALLRLFLRGRDGALYGSSQSPPGNLVRFQPGNVTSAPALIACPADITAPEGSRMVFAPAIRGAAPLFYHWSQSGTLIRGATNAWLGIDSVQPASYGTYSVTISNRFGGSQCSFNFSAPRRLKLSPPHAVPHDMELRVSGSDNLPFVIESSADLQTWTFVTGGELHNGEATVLVSASSVGEHRSFRARYLPIGLPEE